MRRHITAGIATLSVGLVAGVLSSTEDAPASAETKQAPGPVTVPGSFTGYAFDACQAPSQATMNTWRQASPYGGVGIYIGGVQRVCDQPNLNARWVRTQKARGWKILPVYVGLQASCSNYEHRMSNVRATARGQGRQAAGRAVQAAKGLAIGRNSTLFYDLEDYDTGPDACRQAALSFMSGWTKRLHELGYKSGIYSNIAAAIQSLDLAHRVSRGSYVMPDNIWFAWANGRDDTYAGDWVLSDRWDGHRRVHQYRIDVGRTFGGVTLTVDVNWMDLGRGSVAPKAARTCGVRMNFADYPTRRRGSQGAMVSAAQCLLKQQRFGSARVTGRYDRATAAAVRQAQRARGLDATGVLNARTWTTLLARGKSPLLKVGSAGESVRHLQRALTAALDRKVAINGVVTKQTADAVRAYERTRGLKVDGIVDPAVWTRLHRGR
jgi:glycoside hydrolase-like protein/putative peptidoglycan binding protein